jgi:DNA-binding response OmpR family regulator
MRVLVVEASDAERRAIVETLLPLEDVIVQGAVADLRSTLRALAETHLDIVVTGVHLLDGDGLQLVEAVRELGFDPAIVVVGSEPTRAEWQRHLDAGADRVVDRDLELSELRDVVTALVRRAHTQGERPLRNGTPPSMAVVEDLDVSLCILKVMMDLLQHRPEDPELWEEARLAMEQALQHSATLLGRPSGVRAPRRA